MIKINFSFDSKYGKFNDALYLPEEHTFTDAQIEAMKKERFDNWIHAVENPPEIIEEVTETIESAEEIIESAVKEQNEE